MPIIINLDVQLAKKKMSVTDFAAAIDITPANVSVLKNGRAKAVRFTTLDAICRVLDCQPGDILEFKSDDAQSAVGSPGAGDLASSSRRQRPRDAGTAVRPARG